jgi:hypothetical protein
MCFTKREKQGFFPKPPRVERMRSTGDHGHNACVTRVARMATLGLSGARNAQLNGRPGLARSRECGAQWVNGGP